MVVDAVVCVSFAMTFGDDRRTKKKIADFTKSWQERMNHTMSLSATYVLPNYRALRRLGSCYFSKFKYIYSRVLARLMQKMVMISPQWSTTLTPQLNINNNNLARGANWWLLSSIHNIYRCCDCEALRSSKIIDLCFPFFTFSTRCVCFFVFLESLPSFNSRAEVTLSLSFRSVLSKTNTANARNQRNTG